MHREYGAGLWPGAREHASVANGGLMYGGKAASAAPPFECLGVDSPLDSASELENRQRRLGVVARGEPSLSGMWRWRDDVGTAFYQ